jgi:hypothetical protein
VPIHPFSSLFPPVVIHANPDYNQEQTAVKQEVFLRGFVIFVLITKEIHPCPNLNALLVECKESNAESKSSSLSYIVRDVVNVVSGSFSLRYFGVVVVVLCAVLCIVAFTPLLTLHVAQTTPLEYSCHLKLFRAVLPEDRLVSSDRFPLISCRLSGLFKNRLSPCGTTSFPILPLISCLIRSRLSYSLRCLANIIRSRISPRRGKGRCRPSMECLYNLWLARIFARLELLR